MGRKIRLISLMISFILCTVTLCSCYDNSEIEDLAYVIAIGIDEAESNSFNLTFQIAIPKSISGGGSESTETVSFKTDNFLTGLKKSNEYLNREINLSHAKVIVVSEKIAKRGVVAFLNGLEQNLEIRPDINIVVSAEGAKKYIESIQPKLSANPAKHYDLLFRAYETDFLVPDVHLEDYLYRIKSKNIQPVAIYIAVDENINESKPSSGGDSGGDDKSGGQSGKLGGQSGGEGGNTGGKKKTKPMTIKGLAVFMTDKMVGNLNSDETTLFAVLTTDKNRNIEVVDPLDSRFKVLGSISKQKSSYVKVKITDNKPKIDINLKLNVDVKAVQSGNDYDRPENSAKLKKAYEDYFDKNIEDLLKKVTTEYKSDIFGFCDMAKYNFKTIKQWEEANWQDIFPKSEYNLKVNVEIIRHG
jgi:spore germination protein KC